MRSIRIYPIYMPADIVDMFMHFQFASAIMFIALVRLPKSLLSLIITYFPGIRLIMSGFLTISLAFMVPFFGLDVPSFLPISPMLLTFYYTSTAGLKGAGLDEHAKRRSPQGGELF